MDLIVCKNLSKSYGTKTNPIPICHKINLRFPSTGLYGIKGKSGCGKSTFLNLLTRLAKPTGGAIFYKKKNLWKLTPKEVAAFHAKETAIVFQHHNLVEHFSALDNVMLPLLISGMPKVKARKKATALFQNFQMQSLMSKPIEKLSGGEKQRAAILRSLVNDPSTIFADEPTGALDEENSAFVMQVFQKISANHLVILVSHNEELLQHYCPNILCFENGSLHYEKKKEKEEGGYSSFQRIKPSRKWIHIFVKRNLKKNWLLNSVCFLSSLIGFSCLLLCLGFYCGSVEVSQVEATNRLDYQLAKVSKQSQIEIENSPLKLVKNLRPTFQELSPILENCESCFVLNDYSFFYPSFRSFSLNGENKEACQFSPFYELENVPYLSKGKAPKTGEYDVAIVNQEFLTTYGDDCLGKKMSFKQPYSFSISGEKYQGELNFEYEIIGVVREFSFLNEAKVYYPYEGLDQYLNAIYIETNSLRKSLAQLVKEASPDSELSSYSYYLFIEKKKDVKALLKLKEELESSSNPLSISSNAYSSLTAFSTLMDAFTLSLSGFVGIAIAGVCLIIGMTSYSDFMKRKKENAILSVLGAGKKELEAIFSLEAISIVLFSSILSLLSAPLFQKLLNLLIQNKFGIERLIQIPYTSIFNIPYLVYFALPLSSMLLATLSSLLPLNIVSSFPIAEVLKEE